MATPTAKLQLSSLDKAGPYFQKTLGVLPLETQETRVNATKFVAKNAHGKSDFTEIVDILGLGDVVDNVVGKEWR